MKKKLYTTTEIVKELDISYGDFHNIVDFLELEPAKTGYNAAGNLYRLYDYYTKVRVEKYLEEMEEDSGERKTI